MARYSGLPVKHFIAACNANDIVPAYLSSGNYQAKQSIATISNAMDVGNPSNFVRILEIFNNEFDTLKNAVSSYSIPDDTTRATLKEIWQKDKYLADPHGAVGFAALSLYQQDHGGTSGIVLETAHPVKFYDVVEPVLGEKVPIPESLKSMLQEEKKSIKIDAEYDLLKEFLLSAI
jgi:threonine synthase